MTGARTSHDLDPWRLLWLSCLMAAAGLGGTRRSPTSARRAAWPGPNTAEVSRSGLMTATLATCCLNARSPAGRTLPDLQLS